MNVYLHSISGIEDAIISMYISKRNWSRELENHVFDVCERALDRKGRLLNPGEGNCTEEDRKQLDDWLSRLTKWGWKHVTLLRFIDMAITVEGLHRAGQDDWDSHAKRFNNRIIRSSTRLSSFSYEMSDWYKDKILPTDMALKLLNMECPEEIEVDGQTYVRAVNGYIRKGLEEQADVRRGLYMLSIPSTFLFKVDLAEWSHVFKERNQNGTANPEVKICCETIADQIEQFIPQFNRELFLKILN